MTRRPDQQQELERFFADLNTAVGTSAESRSRNGAQLQQELDELFGGLTSEVAAQAQDRRDRDGRLRGEIGEFVRSLIQGTAQDKENQRRALTGLGRDLTGMFALLEPTIAAATVAIRVVEERAREEQDRRTGRRFSAFDLVRTQELDLSRIFAGLLDPAGDHSQGDLFLSLLLEELSVGVGDVADFVHGFQSTGGCRVWLEHPIADRAMLPGQSITGSVDIVLEFEGNRWIGIENKPSALDQPWQVDRYLFALAHEVEQRGGNEEQIFLLYWSGDGTDPDFPDLQALTSPFWNEETRERQERLRSRCLTFPYRRRFGIASVEGWLKRCQVECEADRILLFIRDLLAHIQHTFRDSANEHAPRR